MHKYTEKIVKFGQFFLWVYSKILVKLFLDIQVNRPLLKSTSGLLIISSHVSLHDPFIFVGSLSWSEMRQIAPLRAMLAKWYFHSPLLPFAYFIGCFPAKPITKNLKKYAGTSAVIKILREGQSLGIYPEGQRTPDKRIPAKYGVIKILQNLPENQLIYLCKITKLSHRRYAMTVKRMDEIRTYTDPDKIMDEVYSLTDTIKA